MVFEADGTQRRVGHLVEGSGDCIVICNGEYVGQVGGPIDLEEYERHVH